MPYWPQKSFIVIDTETTGLDFKEDRVIEVCVAVFYNGQYVHGFDWIVNSGKPSAPDAVAVHGITDEMQFAGKNAATTFRTVHNLINIQTRKHLPVMAFNAPFDFSMLRAEFARHGINPKLEANVIDPLVIDRHYQSNIPVFTKPWMRLAQMAERYGVQAPTHRALEDAISTGYVAIEQSLHYPAIRHMSLPELHRKQREWYEEWAKRFRDFAVKKEFQFSTPDWPYGNE
jgi:DNA polymerase-3 subunit epsilon